MLKVNNGVCSTYISVVDLSVRSSLARFFDFEVSKESKLSIFIPEVTVLG